MKLYIQDFAKHKELSENAFTIDPSMLKFKAVHLFIASYKWEFIEIHLNDTIDWEDIKYLHMVSDSINAIIPQEPSVNVLRCLCSLYPESAGALRQAYMCNAGLNRIINNITLQE